MPGWVNYICWSPSLRVTTKQELGTAFKTLECPENLTFEIALHSLGYENELTALKATLEAKCHGRLAACVLKLIPRPFHGNESKILLSHSTQPDFMES